MSSNSTIHSGFKLCGQEFFLLSFFLCYLFLLPLFLLVLFLVFQQWRKSRFSSSLTLINHTDAFTFHLVVLELLGMLGVGLYLSGLFGGQDDVLVVATWLCYVISPGIPLFHVLICVDRYLAIVHPLVYCRLKGQRGAWLRNGAAGGSWLLCAIWGCLLRGSLVLSLVLNFILVITALLMVSFCCIMVLFALIRPKPGDRGRTRLGVDQSKRKAFITIVATLGGLLLRLTVNLVSCVLQLSGLYNLVYCLVSMLGVGFHLPITGVTLFFFLHRMWKLPHQRPAACPQ